MRSLTRLLLGCFMLMLLCGMLHLCNCMEPSKEQANDPKNNENNPKEEYKSSDLDLYPPVRYAPFELSFAGSNSKDSKDFNGIVCHEKHMNAWAMRNGRARWNRARHKVTGVKYQDERPRGFCAGITKAIGLHLLFNYKGQDAKTFANGYSKIVKSLYSTGHLFHLWEIQDDAAVLVKSIAIEITKNNLTDLLDLKHLKKDEGEDEGEKAEKELLAALPDLFPTYSTKGYDKLLSANQISLDIQMIFEQLSPDYPFAFIPVAYDFYKVLLDQYDTAHLIDPPECEHKKIGDSVCIDGAHETVFIITPHFIIYHDSNRYRHDVWTFDPKKGMKKVYSSIEEILMTRVWYHDGTTDQEQEVQECLDKNHDTIDTCITYLNSISQKKLPKLTFKVGSLDIGSAKTKLQNQAKFNKYLKEKYRGSLTDDVFKKVIEDHLIETVEPPLQTFIEALSPAGVRDFERLMWSARELLNEPGNDLLTTPPEPKIVGTLYCLATGGLRNINELKGARGMLQFERSVLTFDLLMLLFSDPHHLKFGQKSAENLCKDYNAEKSNYRHHEIYFIENICTSDGKLREIYTPKNFLNPDKKDELATQQVSAELRRYYECFTANVEGGVKATTPKEFEDFLMKKVIPVIRDYSYSVYLLVKENLGDSPVHGPRPIAPAPYASQISNWPIKNTGELVKSDSIKGFLGQSLFFTYAVPKLLTFLPPGESLDKNLNSNPWQNVKSNLDCARGHLLNKLNTFEECQSTRNSGLKTKGRYLHKYMELFEKGNVNLFTFLYYMLEKCDYVSQKKEVKQETLDGFKSIGFPLNEVDEYVNLFVASFKFYKHSVIFSKDNICGKVISKIEDGHQYLYALVRLIALHHEFQKVAFDCKGPHLPPFLENKQLCYFPQSP
eukprot:Nk52_evm6s48 gene=Nk52_evmTU6s48